MLAYSRPLKTPEKNIITPDRSHCLGKSHFEVDAATLIPIEDSEELVDKYLCNARGEKEAVHVEQLLLVQLTMRTLTQEPPEQQTDYKRGLGEG